MYGSIVESQPSSFVLIILGFGENEHKYNTSN